MITKDILFSILHQVFTFSFIFFEFLINFNVIFFCFRITSTQEKIVINLKTDCIYTYREVFLLQFDVFFYWWAFIEIWFVYDVFIILCLDFNYYAQNLVYITKNISCFFLYVFFHSVFQYFNCKNIIIVL